MLKTGKLTASQRRQIAQERAMFVAEVDRCELCEQRLSLAVHEVARGCDRRKALTTRCANLILCNAKQGIKPSCHKIVETWPREKQLALLLLRRPHDFDLEAYYQIIGGRRKPERSEIDGWAVQLAKELRLDFDL